MQRLIVASTELDLEKDVAVPFVFKIADIRDISKRSGGFSKSIAIPGTAKNNSFFGGLYDFNADFSVFNPNLKTPCVYIDDNHEFINGFMQLKGVSRDDKKNINYNVVLYDSVVDFWKELDKKNLGDLTYDELNHLYTKANIETSWGHDWTDGYYYPMHYSQQTTIKTTDFRPAIYKKYLLDKIMTESGFTWGGNLKTNAIFEKEVLQNSIDRPTISAAVAASKTFRVSKSINELVFTENTPGIALNSGPLAYNLDDEVTPPNDDSNNLWAANKFTVLTSGRYRIDLSEFKAQVEYDYTVTPPITFFTPNGYGQVDVTMLVTIKDTLSNIVHTQSVPFFFSGTLMLKTNITETHTSNALNIPVTIPNTINIYLGQNWTIEYSVLVHGTTHVRDFGGNILPQYVISEVRVKTVANAFSESLFVQYAYEDNVPLIFEDFINIEFDQKQVIKDIITRYNCFVYPDPDNPKNILFNIRDEFYATAEVLDWTSKKDFNTRDQIKLIGELQSEELLLSYSKGDDETNKSYTSVVGESNIYGQFKYIFGNEFVKGEKKIQTPYNPTPLIQHGGIPSMIVSAIHAREPIVGMRVLYAPGLIEVGNVSWNFQYRDASGAIQNSTISGYPYAGHYDDPLNPTIDLNFGELPFPQLYYNINQTTDNNAFNRHWKNTINQTADGRMIISKFHLSSSDVFFIKNNPNTKLFVDNKYYYINKINFEGNESLRGLTTIELITVEDELIVGTNELPLPVRGDVRAEIVSESFLLDPENEIFSEVPVSLSVEVNGKNNSVGKNTERISINGDNNFIDSNVEGVMIQGNNNSVYGSNVTLIGVSNLTIRSNNVAIINGCITKGCVSSILFNKIDGGFNALRNAGAISEINKVCGEKDGEFNLFVVSLFNKIDSNNGITEEI